MAPQTRKTAHGSSEIVVGELCIWISEIGKYISDSVGSPAIRSDIEMQMQKIYFYKLKQLANMYQ